MKLGDIVSPQKKMIEPELFDLIELLVNLPEYNLEAGERGAIVDCYADGKYEVEFTNQERETEFIFPISPYQFILAWKKKNMLDFAKRKHWLSENKAIYDL